ncbi:MAG: diguanylate cyclase/phosphodiesterase (GGDEF & EAL domains) with PAS/PAC sensor(s) [uncultured Solirubrobacteraceae bacterium]|uniref:Diguanylate cyclase/phosphodiesterase (GGDEF & EAL domains) with PAS/PAC sensor(S) n=1 Tax=uncultured Solirubrobacteraceae bacterium TaxID=1162706 RepID=A0A6J4SB03_9ACTN|nr:MAG: diguanylate cyclase/phosphodiesterase (GGDEF & EAL domains) with PAS/PAC sensor(s) [uncultured Solirubrobacteraceae bacterium]
MIGEHQRDWAGILCDVLERPGRVRPHFQPIVDLQRGEVCGYEALARFTGWRGLEPAEVFGAAEQVGLSGALEAHMVREVLSARPHVAQNRFLSVNVSPAALLSDEVQGAFADADRLDSIIVEITEQTDIDLVSLRDAVMVLRERGALIAVDDAGAGYGSLARITALQPHFVKVDRALVAHVDGDPVKAAVVEALGDLAARMDAWVVAEGIERLEELDTLIRMRVPLGQGFAFGRPTPGMTELETDLADHIRGRFHPASAFDLALGPLIEAVPTLPEPVSERALGVLFDRHPGPDFIALVDGNGRPSGLVRRADHVRGSAPVRSLMVVTPEMPVSLVSRRAMARPSGLRFDPLVCTDEGGRYAGLVRMERVIDALASALAA